VLRAISVNPRSRGPTLDGSAIPTEPSPRLPRGSAC
jgi:hypothetical protein